MKFEDLNWPAGLNLKLLASIVPEKKLLAFILDNADKDRKSRRIILPSQRAVKKVIAHYFGTLVEQGKMSWDEAMKLLRGKHKYLVEAGLTKKEVKRLYKKRCEEIENEK